MSQGPQLPGEPPGGESPAPVDAVEKAPAFGVEDEEIATVPAEDGATESFDVAALLEASEPVAAPAPVEPFDPGAAVELAERASKDPGKAQDATGEKLGDDKPAEEKREKGDEQPSTPVPATFVRVGHKGADALVEGNTLESFETAVEIGVDMVELDVLSTREGQLVVAHDHHDASLRNPLTLSEALDGFDFNPLDGVEIDCDLKLAGREAELAGILAGRGLLDRVMVSTMEIESLVKLRQLEPELRLGWTIPKTRRDWTRFPLARPILGIALAMLRRRLPKQIAEQAPKLDVDAVWVYHHLVTAGAVAAANEAGIELYAWTVDDPKRVAELAALGVHGIVSNDPRLLN
jgi:glycerophosphoryl diester phosphodiesterase